MKREFQLLILSTCLCAPIAATANEDSAEKSAYDSCIQDVAATLSGETSASVIYGWDTATGEFIVIIDTAVTRMNLSGTAESQLVALQNLIRNTSVTPENSLVREKCGADPSAAIQ